MSPGSCTKYILFSLLIAVYSIAFAQPAQGLIYGKIKLKNGTQYQGQIRLGDKEALWDDVFDAPKHDKSTSNLFATSKARQRESSSNVFKLGFMALWEDEIPATAFPFRCNFGDVVSLDAQQDNIVLLTLKNGDKVQLSNGRGGDLNKPLNIYDNRKEKFSLNFKDVQSIRFEPAPANFQSTTGNPVYGRILSTMGVFEGYITWDLEECLGKDLISGKQEGVRVDLEFEDISKLQAQRDGSLITLKTGQTLFLNDHDDVSSGNHGIIIRNLAFGKLIIEWENFISATFFPPPVAPALYHDFKAPQLLSGTVHSRDGNQYQGNIIYDLDEIYDIEFLNGKNNGFEYYLQFKALARVEPQNDKFSMAYLKDGRQFLLGDVSDVNANNHGLVVQPPGRKIKYLAWKDIKSVEFE